LLMISFHLPALSQSGTLRSVTGSIVDDQNQAVPFANAALYSNIDSTLVAGAASDVDGKSTIQVRPGNYYLTVSFLSYREKTVPNINGVSRDIEVGGVVFQPDTRVLEPVEIEGERSPMELQLDKRVFNVGAGLSTSGG